MTASSPEGGITSSTHYSDVGSVHPTFLVFASFADRARHRRSRTPFVKFAPNHLAGQDEPPSAWNSFEQRSVAALIHRKLSSIPDVFVAFDLDVLQVTPGFLDAANIDRVDDVAGVGIDRDVSTRTLPTQPFDGGDHAVCIGIAVGFAQRRIDGVH